MSAEAGKTVQVIGGGFAGLSLAYFLAHRGHHVRLVEKAARPGGLLGTLETPYGLVETAANAILGNALVEETAEELGIKLYAPLPHARRRFICRGGRLRRFPLNGPGAARFLLRTAPRFLLARGSLAPQPLETVRAWGERCLGREATEFLLEPALSGVYAGDAGSLSASLILGRFFGVSPGKKRIKRGRLRGSLAPAAGMGEWPRAFHRYLEEEGAEFAQEAAPNLPTIVALPPPAAAEFLSARAPTLAALLARIEMNPLLTATVFLPESARGIEGFGALFPRAEGYRVLGILANDRIFPGRAKPGYRSETWIFGGATDRGAVSIPEAELRGLIQGERARLFGPAEIKEIVATRWPHAIPHYNLALEKALGALREINFTENNYTLFGTYLGNLSLARLLVAAEALARRV